MVLVSNSLIFRKHWHGYNNIVWMDEVEARSLFIAFHLEINNYSPQVLEFGAHTMCVQVVSNAIKSICIWHRWKWKISTRKHDKQCSCGAHSKGWLAADTAGGNLIPHVVNVQVGEDIVGKVSSFHMASIQSDTCTLGDGLHYWISF